MNTASKRYYKNIRTLIPIRGTYEKKLLQGYHERLLELNEINPDITYDDISERLGSPADVVNAYYDAVDVEHLIKRLNTQKLLRRVLFTILILALMGFVINTTLNIMTYHNTKTAIIKYGEFTVD